jgi:hypothetical protein
VGKKHKKPVPKYLAQLLYLARVGAIRLEPGSVSEISVYHDDSCGIFAGKPCCCDPDIRQNWTQHAGSRN